MCEWRAAIGQGPVGVGRPHRSGEPVVGVVRNRHGVVRVAIGDDGDHWSEDLFSRNAHAVVSGGEQGGLDVPARVRVQPSPGDSAPPMTSLAAFVLTDLDVVTDALLLAFARPVGRPTFGIARITHPQGGHFRGERVNVPRRGAARAPEHGVKRVADLAAVGQAGPTARRRGYLLRAPRHRGRWQRTFHRVRD